MTWLFGPIGVQAIKTIKYFKSTFGDLIANSRSRIDPKALHTSNIGRHMGFATQHRADPKFRHMIPKRHLAHPQRKIVPR